MGGGGHDRNWCAFNNQTQVTLKLTILTCGTLSLLSLLVLLLLDWSIIARLRQKSWQTSFFSGLHQMMLSRLDPPLQIRSLTSKDPLNQTWNQ